MLAKRMPGGLLEERLRTWVRSRLERGLTPRLRSKVLAGYIGKPQAWLSMYKGGSRDADFDTTTQILDYFNVSLMDLKQNTMPDEIDVRVLEAVRSMPELKKRFLLDVAERLKAGEPLVVGVQPIARPEEGRRLGVRKARGTR